MSDVVLIELLKTIATVAATVGAMLGHRRYRRYRREKESSAPPSAPPPDALDPTVVSLEPPPFVSDRPTPVYPSRKREKGTP